MTRNSSDLDLRIEKDVSDFIEYIKEGQTARDFELLINTGQMLSIPFIIAGIILIYRSQKNQETTL